MPPAPRATKYAAVFGVPQSGAESQPTERGKVTKVGIAGDQTHVVVNTGLRDQGVREARPTLASQELRPQETRPVPEIRQGLQSRELQKQRRNLAGQLRIAEQLRQDYRRQARLMIGERSRYRLDVDVTSISTGEERDPRAAIDRDHRSSRRRSRSRLSLTLPRSALMSSYARPAATISRPCRTVAVTPSPDARSARSMRSSAISTVIFRGTPIPARYQSRDQGQCWSARLGRATRIPARSLLGGGT